MWFGLLVAFSTLEFKTLQPRILECDEPKFSIAFNYKMANVQTNPRYKAFVQAVFTAGDEMQFEDLLPRLPVTVTHINTSQNRFANVLSLQSYDQLEHNLYANLTARAVSNTFRYLFYKFKKGIFVSITGGKLQAFVPFSNTRFRNEWARLLRVDSARYRNIQELIDSSSRALGYTRTQRHLPLDEWQANDSMFRYEFQKIEGDNNVLAIRDMFQTLCNERNVADIELFVNKRDFPLLKQDGTEPYENLYGTRHQKLVSHGYDVYAPIASGSIANGFADVLLPTYEDWCRAKFQKTGQTLPNANKSYPRIDNTVPWEHKKRVAVFRGSSTGSGTTPATNQRLKALEMAQLNPTHLDVGITRWNTRIRKHQSSRYLETIVRKSYPTAEPLTLQEQTDRYRYLLTLEGHVAAYRLSYELSSGSVVLLAGSKWKLWYSSMLKPYVHYVPVKESLENLIEQIDWCNANETRCLEIIANANEFYNRYLGVDGILDFMQLALFELSTTIQGYSWLPNLRTLSIDYERQQLAELMSTEEPFRYPLPVGPRCVGKLEACQELLRRAKSLEFVKNAYSGKLTTVDVFKVQNVQYAKKTTADKFRQLENTHEAFIGLGAVNGFVARCPNFAFTYGVREGAVYSEYVAGPTLAQWLASSAYNESSLLKILIQLNLALAVAQNHCAFIHYDLFPWNVLIQTLRDPVTFDYNVAQEFPLRVATTVIPIIIDYGKSRAVVYDPTYGPVDRGFINLFKGNSQSLDTLTLIYSVAAAVKPVPRALTDYLTSLGLPVTPEAIKSFNKYGTLVDFTNESLLPVTPMNFVDHLSRYVLDFLTVVPAGGYVSKMSKGSPMIDRALMKTGNRETAALECIVYLDRQTIPTSDNAMVQLIIDAMVRPRLAAIDEFLASSSNPSTRQMYQTVRDRITNYRKKYVSDTLVMNFAETKNGYLQMDSYLTPEEVAAVLPLADSNTEDWVTILAVCSEASIADPELNVFGVIGSRFYNAFNHLNEVASNNTLLWIAQSVGENVNDAR